MKITVSNLTRRAGLSAMMAGIMFVIVGLLHPFVSHHGGMGNHPFLDHRRVLFRPARNCGALLQASGRGRLTWSGRLSLV